jgi:hypothetical protein
MADISALEDILGEGFHTAFRKAAYSEEASKIWKLIDQLPEGEWDAVIEFVAAFLRRADLVKTS